MTRGESARELAAVLRCCRLMMRISATALLFLVAQIASVHAQSPAAPRGGPGASTNCAPTATSPDPNSIATTGKTEPLGDKLARSDGVLCPPAGVDPDIRAPAPDAGSAKMPVIPPPGSPGGDPGIRPK